MTTAAREPLTPVQQALVAKARDLVETTAGLLVSKYSRFVNHAELVSMGNTGLVEAAQLFDPDQGVQFRTFAQYRVEGAMLDGIRKELTFQQSQNMSARMAACEYLANFRDTSNPLTDTDDDCTRRLKAFSDGLLAAMFAAVASRQHDLHTEENVTDGMEWKRPRKALDEASADLPERERKLIELHYRQELDLKQCARELGVSYATVRRYHNSILTRLGARMQARGVNRTPSGEEPK